MCVLIPPTEDLGPQVTDPATIAAVMATRGKPAAVTALARELGATMGMPNADHFHVPPFGGEPVCFLAAWSDAPADRQPVA